MHAPAVHTERLTRRRGITCVARSLGITYSHLYRCLAWMNGHPAPRGRPPGKALEHAIRTRHPELIEEAS